MKRLRKIGLGTLLLLLGGVLGSETAVSQPPYTIYLPLLNTPELGKNVLENPSFEGNWYHPSGIPELQIPEGWQFTWQEGSNPLDPNPWNDFVRPEVRVLTSAFLPKEEQDLFIWDGTQTLKVFKGFGAVAFTLKTNIYLNPGNHVFEIHVFPDLVVDYENGNKIWAPDPYSGEVKLHVGNYASPWMLPNFGEKNRFRHHFTVYRPTTVTIGASFRGRWAIRNNGWFMDDWGVYEVDW